MIKHDSDLMCDFYYICCVYDYKAVCHSIQYRKADGNYKLLGCDICQGTVHS